MVLLVDNIYQIPRGLQDLVVLKVTEKEIQTAFLEYKSPVKPCQLNHCKQRGGKNYRLRGHQTTQISSGRRHLPFPDSLESFLSETRRDRRLPWSSRHHCSSGRGWWLWSKSWWWWPPSVMKMKKMMMLPLKVKMTMATLSCQALPLVHIDLGDLGVPSILWDLTHLRHWWPLNEIYMSITPSFQQNRMRMLKVTFCTVMTWWIPKG